MRCKYLSIHAAARVRDRTAGRRGVRCHPVTHVATLVAGATEKSMEAAYAEAASHWVGWGL